MTGTEGQTPAAASTPTGDAAAAPTAGAQGDSQATTLATDGAQSAQAQATSTQATDPAAAKTGEEGAAAKPDDSAQTAPEKYEFKAPEGQGFEPSVIDAYSEVAKELNLSQENAQKILDKVSPALAKAQQTAAETQFAKWAEDARADKEFGGDNFDANLATAKKALDAYGSKELGDMLRTTGLGNHPEVIRLLVKVGKSVSEDTFVRGAEATPQQNAAARLYGTNH